MLHEHIDQRFDETARQRARQRVINRLGMATCCDHAVAPQPGQMLRQRRLAEPDDLFQLADRIFLFGQEADDPQTMPIGDGLEHGGYFVGPIFENHICYFR